MSDSVMTTHALCRCARIRQLNDQLRVHHTGGHIVLSRGLAAFKRRKLVALYVLLHDYTAFDPDNDPLGEHDMGELEVGGATVLWKITYHDHSLEFASPDPADPHVTTRILTLKLEAEC